MNFINFIFKQKKKWKDELLVWDPNEYDNQTRVVLSSKDIWTPDIVLFNSADVAYSTQRDNYLIDVRSDGTVTWMFPDILRSYCRVDIKYFPFDRYMFSFIYHLILLILLSQKE